MTSLKTFVWCSGAILLQNALPRAGGAGVVIVDRIVILARKFLECFPLSLGNQQGRETSEKHEQRVNLEDVVEPWIGVCAGSTTGS